MMRFSHEPSRFSGAARRHRRAPDTSGARCPAETPRSSSADSRRWRGRRCPCRSRRTRCRRAPGTRRSVCAASARRVKRGPDRKRGLRAAQPDRLIVVEADPDHGQQFRREADEPRVALVVGRAGLAGGVEREAAPHLRGRAFVDHRPQHVRDEVRRIRRARCGAAAPGGTTVVLSGRRCCVIGRSSPHRIRRSGTACTPSPSRAATLRTRRARWKGTAAPACRRRSSSRDRTTRS